MSEFQYYFNVRSLHFVLGETLVLINGYEYRLNRAALQGDDGNLRILKEDAELIFAHMPEGQVLGEYTVPEDPGAVCVSALLDAAWWQRMEKVTLYGDRVVFYTQDPSVEKIPEISTIENILRGKNCGDLRRVFWFEEGSKLVPYHIYLPTDYDGVKTWPAAFFLHGGNGSPENLFVRTQGTAQYLAEQQGMILVGVDAFIRDGSYGYYYPPNPGDPRIDPDCPENPVHVSDEAMEGFRLSEQALLAVIDYVCSEYAIDVKNRFIFGNSMGGVGTFWFASHHPELFNAAVPAGAMVCTQFLDLEAFRSLPYLFVGGTEDHHGFDYFVKGLADFEAAGLKNIRHIYVGGGEHGTAWARELETMFRFFKEHMR